MKTLLIGLLAWLLLGGAARAQVPTWQSALTATTASLGENSVTQATTVDAAGNVYVAGSFRGTVRFGSYVLTSSGSYDSFVAKWSAASRSFAWVWQGQSLTGASFSAARAVAVSGPNVYVAGNFGGTQVSFGGVVLTNSGPWYTHDLYVLKLTDTGPAASLSWVQQAGGPYDDQVAELGLSGSSVYLAGYCGPGASFGNASPTTRGDLDAFVARLTDGGGTAQFNWAWTGGGSSRDEIRGLVVRGNALYVTGFFYYTGSFGGTDLYSVGDADIFAAKLLDTGSGALVEWARQAGGSGPDLAEGLALSGDNLYLTGAAGSAPAAFGPVALPGSSSSRSFVARLTEPGGAAFSWVRELSGTTRAVQASGNQLYVAGQFGIGTSTAVSSATFGSTTLVSGGGTDVFVAGLTDAGSSASVAWAVRAGSADHDKCNAFTLSGPHLLVGGNFNGGMMTLGNLALPSAYSGSGSMFVASLADPALATGASVPAGFTIFPNPAHHAATVRVPAGPGPATLEVFDVLGRVVQHATAPAGQDYVLALGGLAPGVYAVRVQVGRATAVRQLVVE